MSRLRFVKTPTEEIIEQLREIYHGHSDFAFRKRAHAILLSDKGTTINQLQDIFGKYSANPYPKITGSAHF